MTTGLEPTDKLDAAVTSVAVVNGPEDELFDWDAVNWRAHEQHVRRLRQRIFTASQVGDLKRITTCGNWSTSGPGTPTRTSRRTGSWPATSACSTSPGKIGGSSVIATAAPTYRNSPGPGSCGTSWSPAPRHPMTRHWPNTGTPDGDARGCNPQSTAPPNSCSTANGHGVSTAGSSSCTPTARLKPHKNGNSGIAACAKLWITTPSAYDRTAAHTVRNSVCSTHTAIAGPPVNGTSTLHTREP